MHPLQQSIDTILFAGKNLSYNLDFIPDDKLDWKPAPEAKSAFEITAEVVSVVRGFQALFQTGNFPMEPVTFTSRPEAKEAIESATENYAAYLKTLGPDDMEGEVELPFGMWPKTRALALPVIESVHHHGQVIYIQTLLGDKESHFFEMGT